MEHGESFQLNKKAEIVIDKYDGNDPLKRKVASTLLESLSYSTLDSTGRYIYPLGQG
jgi:hypothetical protein